jgi:hypothetical protein
MTNVKVLGAIVIAASALSSTSALAQAAFSNPDLCEAESASCQVVGAGSWSPGNWGAGASGPRYRRTAVRRPAARAAVGPAGAAVGAAGTAAAVATAPFNVTTAPYRGWSNSYAAYGAYGAYGQPATYGMYGEKAWYGDWDTYASRNGIVCRPGTTIKGEDGLQHPCQ